MRSRTHVLNRNAHELSDRGGSGRKVRARLVGSVLMCAAVIANGSVAAGAEVAAAGPTWSIQPTPDPAGGVVLSGVSCISTQACIAVGHYTKTRSGSSKSVYVTLAERWNGTTWSIQTTPDPAKAGASY